MSGNLLFWVNNKHSAASGTAPQVDGTIRKRYHAYFENEYGDQAVFIYDYEVGEGILWFGDAGWERSYTVVDGHVPDLVLSDTERAWLMICWKTAVARPAK